MEFKRFIDRLVDELSREKLPGHAEQVKMAPEARIMRSNKGKEASAAVLILLFEKEGAPYLVLTRRKEYEGAHGGQISLPGGKTELRDGTLIETALRETEEEIGVNRQKITIIGQLTDLYIPVSNFMVSPFIAYTMNIGDYKIDPSEVEYIIECNLYDLLSPDNIKRKKVQVDLQRLTVPYFQIDNEEIWGATAMILSEFAAICARFYPHRLS